MTLMLDDDEGEMTMTDNGQSGVLITGSRVYTADPAFPWAEAILTCGNSIAFVGREADARAQAPAGTESVHVPGGLIVPGLNESHVHLSLAAANLPLLDLDGVVTPDQLRERLRDYGAAHPDRAWIQGYGLFYEALADLNQPPRAVLDAAVSDRPVLVTAFDGHSAWANTAALERAGIAQGAAIARPSEVVVDPASGLATGMLKEHARDLVVRWIAQPTVVERDDLLCQAVRHMSRLGITSVQNMDGDLERLEQYERLRAHGDLSVRAYHYMSVREEMPRACLAEFAALTRRYTDPWNRTRGIKLFIDGVVESKTALMLEPYADGSGQTGVPDMDPTAYREIVVAADALGMDVATHAIGDRGVRLALDAYEAARHANGGRRGRRGRVEHIEVVHPDDIPRFGQLGVTASMQPLHAAPTTDPRFSPWTRLVGPAREPYAFAWRRLVEAGAPLAFGSDWPVVTPDVRRGLHTALTRANAANEPVGGWQPQLSVTLAQALDAYTRGGAAAEAQDDVKGILRPGLLADITAFTRDLFAVSPDEIPTVGIALTVVDGRIVHREV